MRISSFEPKIADFGIAKQAQASGQTREGDILGTACYMAPEQAVGKAAQVGPAADIYSLGVILYEMLTGRVPLQGPSDVDTVMLVRNQEPVPPRRLQPRLPRDLETICLKCLRKEPAARYASAHELAEDLGRGLAGRPIAARPTPAWERAWKWTQRRPALAALIALATLLLCVGLPGVTYLWLEADDARAQELDHRQKAEAAAAAQKQANEIAQTREAETRTVLDFVESRIFAAAGPEGQEGGLGPDVTLRRALEEALPFVEKSFAEQPLIEARLRMVLGNSYLHLGDAKLAAAQFAKAGTLYHKHSGPRDLDTLRSMNQLGSAYSELGRHVDAYELRKETLALNRATLGPDHKNTLASMVNLAQSLGALNRYEEARKLQEEALALYKTKLSPESASTLSAMHNLAVSYYALGRYDDALKLDEETRRLRTKTLGPDHPDTLHSMNNLAIDYAHFRRFEEALELDKKTVALRKVKIGPNHPETLRSMHNLAISYASVSRHVEANEIRQETLARRRIKLGPNHPDTLWSLWSTAAGLEKLGRGAEAVPLIDECVQRAAGQVVNPRMIPKVMDIRLRHFQKIKDAAGCRATADMWEALHRADAGSLYNAACIRAVTAGVLRGNDASPSVVQEAVGEADRAVVWLRQAVAAGFNNVGLMQRDKDLDVLRDRDDFKLLVSELQARQK